MPFINACSCMTWRKKGKPTDAKFKTHFFQSLTMTKLFALTKRTFSSCFRPWNLQRWSQTSHHKKRWKWVESYYVIEENGDKLKLISVSVAWRDLEYLYLPGWDATPSQGSYQALNKEFRYKRGLAWPFSRPVVKKPSRREQLTNNSRFLYDSCW